SEYIQSELTKFTNNQLPILNKKVVVLDIVNGEIKLRSNFDLKSILNSFKFKTLKSFIECSNLNNIYNINIKPSITDIIQIKDLFEQSQVHHDYLFYLSNSTKEIINKK